MMVLQAHKVHKVYRVVLEFKALVVLRVHREFKVHRELVLKAHSALKER
jgi:hypothetical protein